MLWNMLPSGFGQRVKVAASVTVFGTDTELSNSRFFFNKAFRNFMQAEKTICVFTCFLHKHDFLSRSLACFTKNGYKTFKLPLRDFYVWIKLPKFHVSFCLCFFEHMFSMMNVLPSWDTLFHYILLVSCRSASLVCPIVINKFAVFCR